MKRFNTKISYNSFADEFLKTEGKNLKVLPQYQCPSNLQQTFEPGAFTQAMPYENDHGDFVYAVAKKQWGLRMK